MTEKRWETTLTRPNKPHIAAESGTPVGPPKKRTGPKTNRNGYTLPDVFTKDRDNIWTALIRLAQDTTVDRTIHVLIGVGTDQQAVHFDRLKQAGACGYDPSPELVAVARDVGGLPLYRRFIEGELRRAIRESKKTKKTKKTTNKTTPKEEGDTNG